MHPILLLLECHPHGKDLRDDFGERHVGEELVSEIGPATAREARYPAKRLAAFWPVRVNPDPAAADAPSPHRR